MDESRITELTKGPPIYVVTGGTGASGELLVRTVLAQVSLGIWTLKLQLQAPLVTIAHQLLAALLVGLLAAVLARSLGNSGQTLPMSPMSSEVAHG